LSLFTHIFNHLIFDHKCDLVKSLSLTLTQEEFNDTHKKYFEELIKECKNEDDLLELGFLNTKNFFKPLLSSKCYKLQAVPNYVLKFVLSLIAKKMKTPQNKLLVLSTLSEISKLTRSQYTTLMKLIDSHQGASGIVLDILLRSGNKSLMSKAEDILNSDRSRYYVHDNAVHFFEPTSECEQLLEQIKGVTFSDVSQQIMEVSRNNLNKNETEIVLKILQLMFLTNYRYSENVSIKAVAILVWNFCDQLQKVKFVNELASFGSDTCAHGILLNILIFGQALANIDLIKMSDVYKQRDDVIESLKEIDWTDNAKVIEEVTKVCGLKGFDVNKILSLLKLTK
jgi:uncharacterized protein YggL (DUF469 family)